MKTLLTFFIAVLSCVSAVAQFYRPTLATTNLSNAGHFERNAAGLFSLRTNVIQSMVTAGSATNVVWPVAGTNITLVTNGLEVVVNVSNSLTNMGTIVSTNFVGNGANLSNVGSALLNFYWQTNPAMAHSIRTTNYNVVLTNLATGEYTLIDDFSLTFVNGTDSTSIGLNTGGDGYLDIFDGMHANAWLQVSGEQTNVPLAGTGYRLVQSDANGKLSAILATNAAGGGGASSLLNYYWETNTLTANSIKTTNGNVVIQNNGVATYISSNYITTAGLSITGAVPGTVKLLDANGSLVAQLGTNDNLSLSNVTSTMTVTLTNGGARFDSNVVANTFYGSGNPLTFDDEAYGVGWNGDLTAPTKNAVYDKIETINLPMFGTNDVDGSITNRGLLVVARTNLAIGSYTINSTNVFAVSGPMIHGAAVSNAFFIGTNASVYFKSNIVSMWRGDPARPVLSFAGDTHTGIYSAGDGYVNVATDGAIRALFHSGGFRIHGDTLQMGDPSGTDVTIQSEGANIWQFGADTAGGSAADYTVKGADASGGADRSGGDLTIGTGLGVGLGKSSIFFNVANPDDISGTGAQANTRVMTLSYNTQDVPVWTNIVVAGTGERILMSDANGKIYATMATNAIGSGGGGETPMWGTNASDTGPFEGGGITNRGERVFIRAKATASNPAAEMLHILHPVGGSGTPDADAFIFDKDQILVALTNGTVFEIDQPNGYSRLGYSTAPASDVILGDGDKVHIKNDSGITRFQATDGGSVLLYDDTGGEQLAIATKANTIEGNSVTIKNAIINSNILLHINAGSATPVISLALSNKEIAAVGSQRPAPTIALGGHGWKTDATAASQPVGMTLNLIPVQGTANPSSLFVVSNSINNGAFSDIFRLSSAGALNVASTISSGSTIISGAGVVAAASSAFSFSGGTALKGFQNGTMRIVNNADTQIGTVQFNQTNFTKTANYTIAAMDSGITFNNSGDADVITFTLPAALSGRRLGFYTAAAQTITNLAVGSDVIRKGASVTAAAGYLTNDAAIGTEWELICPVDGTWTVRLHNGSIGIASP